MRRRSKSAPLRFAVAGLGHIAQAAVDAVYITLPNTLHAGCTIRAANAGLKHRPTMSQALRRPAVPREPALVQVESGHR